MWPFAAHLGYSFSEMEGFAYEMAQKFEAILENTILKKKVMEELSLSSFPAKMNASIVPESNLMELSVTADSPETAFRVLRSVLKNYTTISDYIIPNVVLETLQQPQVSGVPSNQIPTKKYAATAFLAAALAMAALIGLAWYGGAGGLLFLSAGYRQK